MTIRHVDIGTHQAVLAGEPRTALTHGDRSIHDPERARKLGFRGAAVGGTVHLDCFAPVLLQAFGDRWFERGALSLYFQNVVVSGEPVQALARQPQAGQTQVEVWAQRADDPGFIVATGTASLGDHSQSALSTRDLRLADPDSLRILKGVRPGTSLGETVRRLSSAQQQESIRSGMMNTPLHDGRPRSSAR